MIIKKRSFFSVYTIIFSLALKKCNFKMKVYFSLKIVVGYEYLKFNMRGFIMTRYSGKN